MKQLSIFDSSPLKSEVHDFDSWLETRFATGEVRSKATAVLYREMWCSFTDWCKSQHPVIELEMVNSTSIQQFQASREGAKNSEISPRHALRLLRLIGQVLKHRAGNKDDFANNAAGEAIDAQPNVRYAEAADRENLPQALNEEDAQQLINFLSISRQTINTDAVGISWQTLRNRAAAALQLGAGLGPVEIRSLTVASPIMSSGRVGEMFWKVKVSATGESVAHVAPIADWAAELLQHWLKVRTEKVISGYWLFPSTQTGKQWGKVAQYNAAKQVTLDAGLDFTGGGSFVLRHTFALRQLRHGADPAEVAKWLGVSDQKVMLRYSKMLSSTEKVI